MPIVRRIQHLPPNFGAFVDEISAGMEHVYGPEAAAEYRDSAATRVLSTISHPSVIGLATLDGEDADALLMAIVHEDVGQIFFLHVLQGREQGAPERALLEEVVRILREMDVSGIQCESLIFNPANGAAALADFGFRTFERAVMRGSLNAPSLEMQTPEPVSRPIDPDEFPRAAHCLVSAYAGEPGADLHPEMTTEAGALALIEAVARGSFGVFRPEYARCIEEEGRVINVLFACEAVAKVGFIVQVGTPKAYRGQGHARRMIQETARVFRHAGLHHIALGVTLDNPARRLYEALGMSLRLNVNAYVWRRP